MIALTTASPWPGIAVAACLGFIAGVLTERLSTKVKENRMDTTSKSARSRLGALYDVLAPFLVVACLLASTYASVSTWHQSSVNHAQDVQHATDQRVRTADNTAAIAANQRNAVVNCQNANQSREASLALWNFLFDLTAKSPRSTAAQQRTIHAVRIWIGKLYADRDCADLARKYPIPPPPVIKR